MAHLENGPMATAADVRLGRFGLPCSGEPQPHHCLLSLRAPRAPLHAHARGASEEPNLSQPLPRNEFGCTFYQFVNKYRIEEAQRLMTEQPNLKMTDVASQSGFSSRTAFYNTFTRETGISPSEWSAKCHNS